MSVIQITTATFEQEVLQSEVPVLVDFYADWCGPCKMMGPVIDEIAAEMPDMKFCKLNIDEEMEIAQQYRVMTIPTFIVFKNGEVSKRDLGAIPKSKVVALFE